MAIWVVFSPSRRSYMGWALATGAGGWTLKPCWSKQEFTTRVDAEELAAAVGDGEVTEMAPDQSVLAGVTDDPTYW